jgi:hypothetical protein
MTIDKQNPTQQRQQKLSLSALLSLPTGDLGRPVRSIPNARQDPIERRAFLRSILEQAIELANDVDDCFTDGEGESSRCHSQNQNQ